MRRPLWSCTQDWEEEMSRRRFLERITALAGLALGAQAAPAAPAPETREVELQRSPVAGFPYHDGEALWPRLSIGAPLALVREPDNPHDARAVRVEWEGRKLGYVPRVDNAAVSHLLGAGRVLRAQIVALRASRNPWEGVEFAVVLVA
jgi:hypothetical protein